MATNKTSGKVMPADKEVIYKALYSKVSGAIQELRLEVAAKLSNELKAKATVK